MPKFRTTKTVHSYRSTTIPLFWFVQAGVEQRNSTDKALNEVVDRVITQSPQLERKEVVSVPWLRNYPPSLADVFDTARGFELGEGHVLGVDAQSLEDETLMVLHCVNKKEPEIGRASRDDAIAIYLGNPPLTRTLAETYGERAWDRVFDPGRSPEPRVEVGNIRYTLPAHIPKDTKLQEGKILLFSLIKVTDEEVIELKQDMEDTTNEITIYNWPHDTPASQAETYNLFQCVKPDLIAPCDQTFVMFIDATHLSGPERAPVVVVACESTPKDVDVEEQYSKQERMSYQHIYLHPEEAQNVKQLWPLIWHPPDRGYVNQIRPNYPLLYGSNHSFVNPGATRLTDWNSPVMRYHSHFIAKPGAAIWAAGANRPRFLVYILCTVTSEELRKLRNIIVSENREAVQFLELNLLPREHGNETEEKTDQEPSEEPSTPLDPLLAFFDSPEYRAVADPPSTFIFLDDIALSDLLAGAGETPSVPLAHLHSHFHRAEDTGELFAVDEPAYLYANFSIDQDLESALANLEVGNTWFWELIGMYDGSMGVAFWPEYRGSMKREMLDISEF